MVVMTDRSEHDDFIDEVPQCVICGSVCDDSGLCDLHKYDEQLQAKR